jgi:hypothetical protein
MTDRDDDARPLDASFEAEEQQHSLESAAASQAVSLMSEDTWRARGRQARAGYLTARPWPHLVTHDLLSPILVAGAEKEELARALTLVPHRSHLEVKAESPIVAGPSAEALLEAMSTPAFVAFVEEVTGVSLLVSDPTRLWSGLHASGAGSFQSIHRDLARHPVTAQWHRANVLLYLNTAWPEEYGGDLELWPSDMSMCGARIRPTAGTMVMFETNYLSLHGVPDRIRCPPEHCRLSLTSYYYKDEPPEGRRREPIMRRPRRPQDPWRIGIAEPRHILRGLAQPIHRRVPMLRRALGSLRRNVRPIG